MVVDTLDNLEKYVSLNPLFGDVVEFLRNNDLNKLEPGKHYIKDKDLLTLQQRRARQRKRQLMRLIAACSIFRYLSLHLRPTVICR